MRLGTGSAGALTSSLPLLAPTCPAWAAGTADWARLAVFARDLAALGFLAVPASAEGLPASSNSAVVFPAIPRTACCSRLDWIFANRFRKARNGSRVCWCCKCGT